MDYKMYLGYFTGASVQIPVFDIEEVLQSLHATANLHNRVVVAGNGGSFATALHFSQDLVKACDTRSYTLGSNISGLTAYSNDNKYKNALVDEYKVIKETGDLLFLLSVSGNSKNLLKLADYATALAGVTVVSLVGSPGGSLRDYSHSSIIVPSENYGIVESIHSMLCHYFIQELADAKSLSVL